MEIESILPKSVVGYLLREQLILFLEKRSDLTSNQIQDIELLASKEVYLVYLNGRDVWDVAEEYM